MIRIFLPFTFQILKLNLAISPIVAFFGVLLSKPFLETEISPDRFIYLFLLSFCSGGFLVGLLFFEFSKYREYYFYYNFGISKIKLISVAYLFHLLIAVVIIIITTNVKHF
jgi:hypothetical protein